MKHLKFQANSNFRKNPHQDRK